MGGAAVAASLMAGLDAPVLCAYGPRSHRAFVSNHQPLVELPPIDESIFEALLAEGEAQEEEEEEGKGDDDDTPGSVPSAPQVGVPKPLAKTTLPAASTSAGAGAGAVTTLAQALDIFRKHEHATLKDLEKLSTDEQTQLMHAAAFYVSSGHAKRTDIGEFSKDKQFNSYSKSSVEAIVRLLIEVGSAAWAAPARKAYRVIIRYALSKEAGAGAGAGSE